MERKHAGFARSWRPVDEYEGEGLAAVRVMELIRENDISGRVLWKL